MSIRGRRAWKRAAFTRTKRAAARAVVAAVVLCGLAPRQAAARVTLPAVIGDHMVLQQQTDVALWGSTDRGREVVVVTSWDQKKYTARPDAEGKWRLRVRTPRAGGPYGITFSDGDPLILNDVLIGEVWLASGQSNMEFKLDRSADAAAAVREANYPGIRFFKVARQIGETPLADVPGSAWVPASPDTAGSFSAVAYHFARTLHRQTGVPVGIIHASWGGTPAEAWTPGPVLAADARLHVAFDRWQTWERDSALTAENEAKKLALYMTSRPHREPGVLYGGMIAPVVPYTLKGFLWYQGESNLRWADEYEHLLSTMIRSWRVAWETEPTRGAELPFLLVEIAPFRYADMGAASVLREAQQRVANTVARAGIVTTIDLGDMEDIHPTRKREVGERLAHLALARNYGFEHLIYSGPVYRRAVVEASQMRLYFDHADGGLTIGDQGRSGFEISGESRPSVFRQASARVEGRTVVVWRDDVPRPAAVRYAWGAGTENYSLFNGADVPAASFRTDSADGSITGSDPLHLFLLVGQSNMAGRGTPERQDSIPHPGVWMLGADDRWVSAVDPMHADKPAVSGVGPGRSFAITLAAHDSAISIGLVPAAVGGTSIIQWVPGANDRRTGTHPYDDALRRARSAMRDGQLKAILWHQGESDANERSAAGYERRLEVLIRRMREDLGDPNLPFLVGQLGHFRGRPWDRWHEQIDQAHRALSRRLPNVVFVSSADLEDRGDNTHFSAAAARELGRRYAEAYLALPRKQTLAPDSNGRRAWTQPEWVRISEEPETARPARGVAQLHSLTHPSLTP